MTMPRINNFILNQKHSCIRGKKIGFYLKGLLDNSIQNLMNSIL